MQAVRPTDQDLGNKPMEPGWYDDPEGVADQVYWDGETWTGAKRLRPLGFWLIRRSSAGRFGIVVVALGAWTLIALPDYWDLGSLGQVLGGTALLVLGSSLLAAAFGTYARKAYVVDNDWSTRVVLGMVLALAAIGWLVFAIPLLLSN